MLITKETYFRDNSLSDSGHHSDNIRLFEFALQYSSSIDDNDDFSSVITRGLKIYGELKIFLSSSVFLLDENNFLFKHRITIPHDKKNDIINTFSKMVECGTIGTSIEANICAVFPDNNVINSDEDSYFIVFPLGNSKTVFGLLVLESKISPHEIDRAFMNTIKMIINIYKLKIERSLLSENLRKTQSYIKELASEKALKLLSKELIDLKF